jgi:hypothetical protein
MQKELKDEKIATLTKWRKRTGILTAICDLLGAIFLLLVASNDILTLGWTAVAFFIAGMFLLWLTLIFTEDLKHLRNECSENPGEKQGAISIT